MKTQPAKVHHRFPIRRRAGDDGDQRRQGAVLVLVAAVLLMTMIFAAFTVDVGFISLTKAELQRGADSASLSAVLHLEQGLGPGATLTPSQTEAKARDVAVSVAAANRGGGLPSITADSNSDVRVGNVVWDPNTSTWVKSWGTPPFNMVEVTLHRSSSEGANDGPLPLFFGPVIDKDTQEVSAKATAALLPAVGFRLLPGQPGTVEILPIALDEGTWDNMLAGGGSDNFTWDEETQTISSGTDGIREVNLYPEGSTDLPPGNRGTVDFGSSNNSTADLSRQILYGLNADDLSYFGGEIRFDNGPLSINGDTGLSAAIKDELAEIKGKPRAIPLFTEVSGPGNNAQFTVVRLVGIRILDVRLTGKNKYVVVQPAPVSSRNAIPGSGSITTGSVTTAPILID